MLTASAPRAVPLACRPQDMAAAIERCVASGAAVLGCFDARFCAELANSAGLLTYRRARPVVGEADRQVLQDFELTMEFPPGSPYRLAARLTDAAIAAGAALLQPNPLPPEFTLNDLILQRYPAGSRGITPHRDHIRYRGLVAILVVAGDGRFCLCEDRCGQGKCEIAAGPGDLLLMRAPGLAGSAARPFHCLEAITIDRLSFGMRWDVSAAAKPG